MNQNVCRSVLPVLLACVMTAPARADDSADLQLKLDRALKGAKSFVVTTMYPAQEYSSTLVFVAPDRSRVAVAVAADTTDVVTVGRTIYSSKNGAPFERSSIAATTPRPPGPGSVKVVSMHPDVTSAGTRYGSFETTVPLGKLITLTCTYEKKNYRLVRCANDEVTQTYNSYDNPSNAVDVPINAIDAPSPLPTTGAK